MKKFYLSWLNKPRDKRDPFQSVCNLYEGGGERGDERCVTDKYAIYIGVDKIFLTSYTRKVNNSPLKLKTNLFLLNFILIFLSTKVILTEEE